MEAFLLTTLFTFALGAHRHFGFTENEINEMLLSNSSSSFIRFLITHINILFIISTINGNKSKYIIRTRSRHDVYHSPVSLSCYRMSLMRMTDRQSNGYDTERSKIIVKNHQQQPSFTSTKRKEHSGR